MVSLLFTHLDLALEDDLLLTHLEQQPQCY